MVEAQAFADQFHVIDDLERPGVLMADQFTVVGVEHPGQNIDVLGFGLAESAGDMAFLKVRQGVQGRHLIADAGVFQIDKFQPRNGAQQCLDRVDHVG